MKLTFHGGAGAVTGANYLLESPHQGKTYRLLIDCGLIQGCNFCERTNFDPFPYNPAIIDSVCVTHAHIDHTGLLPKLYAQGFRGEVHSTEPTRDFAEHLLLDSEHLLAEEAARAKAEPIYYTQHVIRLLEIWRGHRYHKSFSLGPFRITFFNAGHILGSSFIQVEAEGKNIIFSGDLGNSPAPIIGARESIPRAADYCLIESTYGSRVHEPLEERRGIFRDLIKNTIATGGTLMIPAFAMERTQQLLYELNELVEHGEVPKIPVFLDSPLAIRLTRVYERYKEYFDKETQAHIYAGDEIFKFPGLKMSLETHESKAINGVQPPKVIIAGAGMSNGGRILHHERRYLPDPKSTLLVVGYQAVGSLGRLILDGAEAVTIMGERVPVRAQVKAIGGYSAHADQPQLLDWLRPARGSLQHVFAVQGESPSPETLVQKINDQFGVEASVPSQGLSVDL